MHAGHARVIGFDLCGQGFAQLGQFVKAETLGEFVIDGDGGWRFNGLHGDIEHGVFACEVFCTVVSGECNFDGNRVASLGARELLFKTRNETA